MKMHKNRSGVASKITIAIVLVALIVTVGAVIFINLYNSSFFADQKAKDLTVNYYENSIYPKMIDNIGDEDREHVFESYQKEGWIVKLRQLINYELVENGNDYRSYFENESYKCDTNTSTIKIIPRSPYGKKDYDIEYNLQCTKE